MDGLKTKPGPDATRAFRFGMMAAVVAGLCAVALVYQYGAVSLYVLAYTVLILAPIYLVLVASVLSVWLGFDKDVTDLRPVYRDP